MAEEMKTKEVIDEQGCAVHTAGVLRVEMLEKHTVRLCKKVAKMARILNIGIGLYLGAALIVSVFLWNADQVKADMKEAQAQHEIVIDEKQNRAELKLDKVEAELKAVGQEMAALSEGVKNSREDIKELKEIVLRIYAHEGS